jgi:hypothetical protein
MQRMGGINDISILSTQAHCISVGQDKKLVLWDGKQGDPKYQRYINEEIDEGNAVAV